MKVLNLYAGIGGNRKLWEDVEVTAIENNKEIAKIYQDFFPNDKVIIADAHQYLLEHYEEFDFIWASPPCPTHSRMRTLLKEQGCKDVYPDMTLYQEILFLTHFFKGNWVIENVISYYEPLIIPYVSENHYFWSNFHITKLEKKKRGITRNSVTERTELLQKNYNIDLSEYEYNQSFKSHILSNCVNPKLGLHIFKCAFKIKQETLNTRFQ